MNDIFSIPISRKRQTSMRRRFIVFSSILFFLIFIFGSAAFIVLMYKNHYKSIRYELMQTIEIERLKLEASLNSEIAIDIVNTIYQDYSGTEELYFFNAAGEITEAKDIALVENKVNITEVLGKTGEEILARTKILKNREIEYFETIKKQKIKNKKQRTKDKRQIVAVSSIPSINWYITAVRPTTVGDFLQTDMTALFGVMMATIFTVFVVFNIFVVEMLGPFNRMVKAISQTLLDWELKSHEENHRKDEIGTLGEFLNMAIIDQLTGIYNRRYMDGHLKKILKSLARTESNFSLLLVDVDYFKRYNDMYGHDAGDNCLRMVAIALSQCVSRDIDFVARYGGEEFAVVLPNTNKNGAQVIAEKLLEKIRWCNIPHKASDVAGHVTISIGGTTSIVKYSQYAQDYLKAADKALYESKKNGRNRYTFENFEEKDI